jgi:hypothetical protein
VSGSSSGDYHYFGERMPWSTNPFTDSAQNFQSRDGLVVENISDWSSRYNSEWPFAVVFENFTSAGQAPFPVFYIPNPAAKTLVRELSDNGVSGVLSFYEEFRTGDPKLGTFSSKGPSMTGIIKPDVVAPGEHISSARSKTYGVPLHDENPLDLQRMTGTSMATPNVAGSAALIQQYFRSGFYRRVVEPTGRFLKGMLIHCADPIPPDRKFPNHQFGFGQINVGRYLPFENSSFSILVNETVLIGRSQHLVSNVTILSNQNPLRITISYLDPAASADSLVPLLVDLDLIVLSETGKVFRGNHYLNGSEEHFSTTERVILNPDEIEIGDYEIHVISSLSGVVADATFSLIVTGDISKNQSDIEFTNATSCLPSTDGGTCNSLTLIRECSSTRIGQSCQIATNIIPVSQNPVNQSFTVQPLESLYVRFTKPSNSMIFAVHVSGDVPILLRLFFARDTTTNGIPFKYQTPVWNNNSMRSDWEMNFTESVVDLLIRNKFSVPWTFRVWGKDLTQATVTPAAITSVLPSTTAAGGASTLSSHSTSNSHSTSPSAASASTGLSGGIIATIVIVPVVVIAAAVVIIFILRGRRSQDIARFDGP